MKGKKLLSLICSASMLATMFSPAMAVKANMTQQQAIEAVNQKAPEPWGALPDSNQYKYQKDNLATFVHFGMNTFTGNEWGNGKEDVKNFALKNFDAEKLVKTVHDAGFKKVIVTAKHHDGFCIWPSAYTEHDAQAAGYEGDILAELSSACTKYNMDMGLYLSPWDVNSKAYGYFDKDGNALVDNNGNPKNNMTWEQVEEKDEFDYNEYYNNQLIEILGNKKYGNDGHFVEVWMDGAKGAGSSAQNYTFGTWYDTIQKYEGIQAGYDADCMLFGANSHSTVYWIGNEDGFAADETWAKINVNKETDEMYSDTHWQYFMKGFEEGNQWAVPECDGRITSGWFWGEHKKTPKSMETLADMYFRSVGHNATMLLNIPPNNKGTVDDAIVSRVTDFGNNIKETFANNLAKNATVTSSETRGDLEQFAGKNVLDENQDTYWTVNEGTNQASLTLDLHELKTFDVVSIEEEIRLGQRIKQFKVEYLGKDGQWKVMSEGKTIGSKRLVRSTPVKGSKVRITVTTSSAVPILSEVGVYKASEGFSLGNAIPDGLSETDVADKVSDTNPYGFSYNDRWTLEQLGINNTNIYAATGAELTFKFHGTKVYLVGTKDPNHGKADIYIDNKKVSTINTSAAQRSLGNILYESETLEDADHTLKLVVNNNWIGLETAYYLNNGGKGMFEFDQTALKMYEDSTMDLVVHRIGGATGEASVLVQDNPGSAVQGDYYTGAKLLTFKDQEVSKKVQVRTKRDPKVKGDIFFSYELVEPTNDAIVGFKDKAVITINDLDAINKEQLQELVSSTNGYYEAIYSQGWDEFNDSKKHAQDVIKNESATNEEVVQAYLRLEEAIKHLVSRELYTEESPYHFPMRVNETNVLEAEFAVLENTGPADEEYKLRVATGDWASNKKFVGCLDQNDMIHIAYDAQQPGIYELKVYYTSGDPKNALRWSEANGKIKAGTAIAGASSPANVHTVTFEMEVVQAGHGVLTFVGPERKSPNIDKFDVTLKEAKFNTADLSAKIDELQALQLQENDYTAETWNVYATALEHAIAVKNAPTSQTEVSEALAQLEAAYSSLAKKELVRISNLSISLHDCIGVNYYLSIEETALHDKDAYIVFTRQDQSQVMLTMDQVRKNLVVVGNETYYKVSVPMAARQMNDAIQATFVSGNKEQKPLRTVSVTDYASVILEDASFTKETKDVVEAMLNYGAMAQMYFDYDVEHLANAKVVNKDYEAVTADQLKEFAAVVSSNEIQGLTYAGTNLRLLSESAIRHHFTVTKDIRTLYENKQLLFTTTCNGQKMNVTPVFYGENKMYVEIKGVLVENFDQDYTLTITDTRTNRSFCIEYSALSYAHAVLNSKDTKPVTVSLVKALFDYNQKAKIYKSQM